MDKININTQPMPNPTFAIGITTKNRLTDLVYTLDKIKHLLDRKAFLTVVNRKKDNKEKRRVIYSIYSKVG